MKKQKYGWYKGWWLPINDEAPSEYIDPFLLDRNNKINRIKKNIQNGKTRTR